MRPYQKHYQVASAKMHFFKLFFTLNFQVIMSLFFD